MFPSYAPHGTEQTDLEEARISVTFDVIPAEEGRDRKPPSWAAAVGRR